MLRSTWPLVRGRPVVEVTLQPVAAGRPASRILLADTGAGSALDGMEFVLNDTDPRRFSLGGAGKLNLGGAFAGSFPAFWVSASIPALGFAELCIAVAIPTSQLPRQLHGIACFRFLNRFAYGNFGNSDQFGLEI